MHRPGQTIFIVSAIWIVAILATFFILQGTPYMRSMVTIIAVAAIATVVILARAVRLKKKSEAPQQ